MLQSTATPNNRTASTEHGGSCIAVQQDMLRLDMCVTYSYNRLGESLIDQGRRVSLCTPVPVSIGKEYIINSATVRIPLTPPSYKPILGRLLSRRICAKMAPKIVTRGGLDYLIQNSHV